MKTSLPPSPEPEVGPKYWRSPEQLADTREFRQWLEREFPAQAAELTDPVSRRHFVNIMSASFLLAGVGLTGCRQPEEQILPFSKMPDDYVHGVARYYATAMPSRAGAIPLLVRSHDGRPTKIEGNAEHPDSSGGTDTFAQASILGLYDPDRAKRFGRNGQPVPRERAFDFLAQIGVRARAAGGRGLAFLMEQSSSPSRLRLQQLIARQFPAARWFVYEPVDVNMQSQSDAGRAVSPYYKLEASKVIVSFDCDFLGGELDSSRLIAGFARGRKMAKPEDGMNRLYAVEALLTQTGSNADHRLRVPASAVLAVAAAVAARVVPGNAAVEELARRIPLPPGVPAEWISGCANDLLANRGASLVLAGYRQPMAVRVLADLINAALQNVGQTLFFHELAVAPAAGIVELVRSLQAGQVETLLILGGNPAYNAPADLEWSAAQAKAKTVVRLGAYEDESSWSEERYAGQAQPPEHWDLPAAHFLESWGDARTSDGTLVPIQPLIAPLFGGVTELEVLARIAGLDKPNPYGIVRDTFEELAGPEENSWRKFLHDGYLAGSAARHDENIKFPAENVTALLGAAAVVEPPGKDRLEVVFARDYRVDDGRYVNNGWLQELPDPITKLTWENVIMVSPQTAQDLGLEFVDGERAELRVPVVRVELGKDAVEGPVWIQPGLADHTVGLLLGYGRRRTGRVGRLSGYDAYRLRTWPAMHMASGARLTVLDRIHSLASTQNHWSMEGRPIIREANLETYREHPDFVEKLNLEEPLGSGPLYPNPLEKAAEDAVHSWGMSIDLNACVGCAACVVACQSENNIPIVGKQQVAKSREMHWLRIDRYYAGPVDHPQVVNQPMLCQHCEAAPCESVCPVNATVHDDEGLNLMVYNRCVGTRYCSNNCPYKVRRYNFFDYNRRPLDKLYQSPLTETTRGEWELKRWFKNPDEGSRAEDEWDLLKMLRNPDVSVRMRGVMEKCTFCVQRIEQAKIARKIKARDSGDIAVPDGAVQTACQQACPAEAIVFGNIKDPAGRVSREKSQPRSYSVLEFLATRPRLTYLARLRNPNPKMPDHHQYPLSLEEYAKKNGDPFRPAHRQEHRGGDAALEGKKGEP